LIIFHFSFDIFHLSFAADRNDLVLVLSAVLASFSLGSIVVIAYVSRQKKSATGELQLTGMTAVSSTLLDPEGAVLVNGELWRARSVDGRSVRPEAFLRVVGSVGHLLLVEAAQANSL